jgi:RimJ/RimL family protein N-acetyltransferase
VRLLPLDTPELIELAASWLARKENYQWFDFGSGRRLVTPTILKIMVQRESYFIRAYTSDSDEVPIGIVGLSNVDRVYRTGTFWGLSGDKSFRNRGFAYFAGTQLLTLAFRDLGLHAVNTWIVDGNPSIRTLQRCGFQYIGRLRQSHYIDDKLYDRLMFDLLASEHEGIEDSVRHRGRRSIQETVRRNRENDPGPEPGMETGHASLRVRASTEMGAGVETQSS